MNRIARISGGLAAAAVCMTIAAPALAATPTPEELIENAIKAMGGKKNIEAIETLHVASEMSAAMGTMTGEVFWAKPNRVIVKRNMPQMGEMTMGTDGKIGWLNHPMMGYQIMGPEELEQIHDQVIHMRVLKLKQTIEENAKEYVDVLESQFDGKKAYELKIMENEDGEQRFSTIYFDTDSGLILGMRIVKGDGDPSTVTLKDWKKVNNVQFFTTMAVNEGPNTDMTMTFSEISVNDVDPKIFAVPAEVKAKAKEASAAPDVSEMTIDDFSPEVQPMIKGMIENLPDTVDGLDIYRGQLESRLGQVSGEMKKGMEFVIHKINEKMAALGG